MIKDQIVETFTFDLRNIKEDYGKQYYSTRDCKFVFDKDGICREISAENFHSLVDAYHRWHAGEFRTYLVNIASIPYQSYYNPIIEESSLSNNKNKVTLLL